jgi:hypothetical protein
MVIPVELEVQWWMSLTISSPKTRSFYLTSSPGPTQLSHFCQIHSIVFHVPLSILIRPDPAGDLQLQVLSYMGRQNPKAEVDQSLEPDRDHKANKKNPLDCSKHMRRFRESEFSQVTQSLYTRSTCIRHHEELFWYN